MDRKSFLKSSIGICLSCCGAAAGLAKSLGNSTGQISLKKKLSASK